MSVDRHITLEGAANFRDLGGLVTTSGATIRRGRIFRSDALFRLTAADVETLTPYGLRTVIDLRSDEELQRSGPGLIHETDIRHERVPIVDVDPRQPESLEEMYVAMLRGLADRFRRIFDLLAAENTYPVVVHCWAGKDRTGIVTALVLAALGVPDDEIIADYALTEANMRRLLELSRPDAPDFDYSSIPPAWLEASPETMRRFLAAVETEWGSIPGYLSTIGVPEASLATIAAVLLEPTTA